MKLFFGLRHMVILSLAIVFTSVVFVNAEQVNATQSDGKRLHILDTIATYSHEIGSTIAADFHDMFNYVEDVFNIKPGSTSRFKYDATLVGFVNSADGIGRHPILFKECLEKNVKMNFLSTRNIPAEIEDSQLGLARLDLANKQDIGAVSILLDIIADKELNIYKKMPDSPIKIAYTMFESTAIPDNWVSILNNKFDMAIVPDQYLIEVYKNCGVQIPIFVLPLPLMLQKFLDSTSQVRDHKPFVFGMTGGFWKRKNHIHVLKAFAREFGNSQRVRLKLHGRFGKDEIIKELYDEIAKYQLTNVEVIVKPFTSDEYLNFFQSLDCYVLLSMGEGFSITPREALACGIPCILTDNTAQKTICNSGSVRVVRSEYLVPAIYDCHYSNRVADQTLDVADRSLQISNCDALVADEDFLLRSGDIGYQFDCTLHDAREAMRDVYKNYSDYLEKASYGREWVKCYLKEKLIDKYVSVVKPETVILGKENIIGDKFLMTNSKKLYEKYKYILGN